MRKIKLLCALVIAISIIMLLCTPCVAAIADPDIQADAALLVEMGTGKILYSRNQRTRLEPASVTKIMTALIAIEAYENGEVGLHDTVTASSTSQEDLIEGGSTQSIKPGEMMAYMDLLYCALMASANEACNILAEHVSGDIETFVKRMNERADELGCTDTKFANTHGLPNEEHYTNAWDLYLIMEEALKHELFASIIGETVYTTNVTNLFDARRLKNTNALLHNDSEYFYEFCTGGKTGSTTSAGYCLAATASKEDMGLISIVLGAESVRVDGSWQMRIMSYAETKRLFEWGYENYSYRPIISKSDLIVEVPVEMGDGVNSITLSPQEELVLLLSGEDTISDFKKEIVIYSENATGGISAPVNAGDVIGEMTVYRGEENLGTIKLLSNATVGLKRLDFAKDKVSVTLVSPIFIGAIAAIVLILALYVLYVVSSSRKRKREIEERAELRKRLVIEKRKQVKAEHEKKINEPEPVGMVAHNVQTADAEEETSSDEAESVEEIADAEEKASPDEAESVEEATDFEETASTDEAESVEEATDFEETASTDEAESAEEVTDSEETANSDEAESVEETTGSEEATSSDDAESTAETADSAEAESAETAEKPKEAKSIDKDKKSKQGRKAKKAQKRKE